MIHKFFIIYLVRQFIYFPNNTTTKKYLHFHEFLFIRLNLWIFPADQILKIHSQDTEVDVFFSKFILIKKTQVF